METFDWIVIGNGLAGAALSYELAKLGQSVLLVDDGNPDSATRCSYGGIAYWSGTDATTKQLCKAGIERHRQLSDELGRATEFRELDLLLTFAPGVDSTELEEQYSRFAIAPHLITPQEAQALEPQLKIDAIGGAFTVKHGHVNPINTLEALNQAFRCLGGQQLIASVTGLVRINDRVTGITTPTQAYAAGNIAVAAGGYSRRLLKNSQLAVPLYHTHAEIVALPTVEQPLRTLIMPAVANRFEAEAKASDPVTDGLWDGPPYEIAPPILDTGVIQFLDKSTYIGQISRFRTDLVTNSIDAAQSDAKMRQAITAQLPCLRDIPGRWRHCVVTFSRDGLPLIGPMPGVAGLHIFSGFTSPFAMLLPIAERFAQWIDSGQKTTPDGLVEKMLVTRFENS
ncbi:FAD-binding oxidoreductase [Leptolyngbyaceae cyanobacterium CCMR0082]|uniref:FAD-binding oxidoreductase n=2 Tax=Adonisia turfae TaxID=2950184 RepID=A0A6M0SB27_9CYAN|nr:FAD-binding oxidoreductase [Adonisia turfae]MDV3350416.1 FAD-binding oxidoreductase [Leptothoe sp. LEGE 181152]NEZ60076.1 FAD-binding oxidoreductase [Adonisia turfae CCMR0081]NEZ65705.1 FAD-binding oxidoreductase [Adonisia turfae CCMR0082]